MLKEDLTTKKMERKKLNLYRYMLRMEPSSTVREIQEVAYGKKGRKLGHEKRQNGSAKIRKISREVRIIVANRKV